MPGADMETVMRTWAGLWAMRATPEMVVYLISIDVHAPNIVRTNYVLQQLDSYYKTFGVTASDGMYVAPKDRVNIW